MRNLIKGLAIMLILLAISIGTLAITARAETNDGSSKDSSTMNNNRVTTDTGTVTTPTNQTVVLPPQQSDNLGNLIVLNSLFNPTLNPNQRNLNLAALIAVDRSIGGGYGSYYTTGVPVVVPSYGGYYPGSVYGGYGYGGSSLGDLIVLNSLFNNGTLASNNLNGLAGLIAVDRLVR